MCAGAGPVHSGAFTQWKQAAMPSIDTASVCAHIVRLSARHSVEPLAVVGLLAVHALVDVDFPRLRVWSDVASRLHRGLGG